MPAEPGTLERIAIGLANAFRPLESRLAPGEILTFLRELGLDLPPALLANAAFVNDLNAAGAAVGALPARITALRDALAADDALGIVAESAALTAAVTSAITALDTLTDRLRSLAGSIPGVTASDVTAFANTLAKRIFEYIAIAHVQGHHPIGFTLARLLGVIDHTALNAGSVDPVKPPVLLRELRLDRIADLLTRPADVLSAAWGWGTAGMDGEDLLHAVRDLLREMGVPAGFIPADEGGPAVDIFGFRIGLAAGAGLPGLAADARLDVPAGFAVRRPFAVPGWAIELAAGGAVSAATRIEIRPPADLTFVPPGGSATGNAVVRVFAQPTPPQTAFTLLSALGATRVEARVVTLGAGASWENNRGELIAEVGIFGGRVLIGTEGADGFLASLLSGVRLEVDFDLGASWGPAQGLRLRGSSGIELALAVNLGLGPLQVPTIYIVVGTADGAITLELSSMIRATLGPLLVVVDRMGAEALLSFPDGGGNLGPAQFDMRFKAPQGLGLSVDGGGFKGGGFMRFDPPKGEYFGMLELEFQGIISVRAVGILNTRMPDGTPGFSLLIIIVAEFPPIQLGFGFTLLGVGGLLGLNRTVLYEPLQAGVRDGSLNSVLFPRDVVANAPRIINDLKRIFPPLPDRFLIGPMGKLGWGTPTLISLELGLLLEIPRPAFAILGVLRVNVPAEEVALLRLQVNFLGIVDFEKRQLSFDASLFDSRLLTFTLTGDMAIRIYWGENANFLMSAGGFHPAYTPPPMGLGPLRRMAIIIFQGNPSVRAEAYFAVTSNTVQFGAKVEVQYGIKIFNVYGMLSLDVLIQFDPFGFIAEIAAMVAVRSGSSTLFSIKLELTLSGPTPWNARGRGSFKIGFIIKVTISVRFDVTVGERRDTSLPPVDVLPKLRDALALDGNWRAVLPPESHLQVTVREIPAEENVLVLHPFGSLEIAQKLVPLNLDIARFGTQRPENGRRFRIEEVRVGDDAAATEYRKEQFAPAQFLDMNDAAKLSSRSFDRFDAGVRVGGGERPHASLFRRLQVAYEVIYLPVRHASILHLIRTTLFDVFSLSASIAKSPLSARARRPSGLGTAKVHVEEEQFAVATTRDLGLHDGGLVFASEAEARGALRTLVERDAALDAELQVVPLSQVVRR
ncbi:MAG TPA: DUF6603 domain-containing protein [Longimicrobiales bacterium]|nr:DUF6603 domain-containing protein [Longimicrobiales bacterium]